MVNQEYPRNDRYGFCVIGGQVLVMEPKDRDVSTQEWMANTLNLSPSAISVMPRGYLLPGRIQFFCGNYNTCPDVTENMVMDAVACHASLFGLSLSASLATSIYNGVISGVNGETWPPILEWDLDIGRWEVVKR